MIEWLSMFFGQGLYGLEILNVLWGKVFDTKKTKMLFGIIYNSHHETLFLNLLFFSWDFELGIKELTYEDDDWMKNQTVVTADSTFYMNFSNEFKNINIVGMDIHLDFENLVFSYTNNEGHEILLGTLDKADE